MIAWLCVVLSVVGVDGALANGEPWIGRRSLKSELRGALKPKHEWTDFILG
jgi:hypothetical protein